MPDKIRVGVLCGGRSSEHKVSLHSAQSIINNLDTSKYEVVPIGITPEGQWLLFESLDFLENKNDSQHIQLKAEGKPVSILPWGSQVRLIDLSSYEPLKTSIDVIFPVLHGPYGEDGSIQGLLKLTQIPYVGPGILGSALAMDKDAAKRIMKEAGIPTAHFVALHKEEIEDVSFDELQNKLGTPLFVKPANQGSSVGIQKIDSASELKTALHEAFSFDRKVIVEEYIEGREIECSVLGNYKPLASLPGEIIATKDFYTYEAKYLEENEAKLIVPAKLPDHVVRDIQILAIKAFKTLCCEGMARCDFFLAGENEIYINEVNTIPGFTKISMYPKLWDASGLPFPKLLDKLIGLAFERKQQQDILKATITI